MQAQEVLQEALDKSKELKAAVDVHKRAHEQRQPQAGNFKDDLNWCEQCADSQCCSSSS